MYLTSFVASIFTGDDIQLALFFAEKHHIRKFGRSIFRDGFLDMPLAFKINDIFVVEDTIKDEEDLSESDYESMIFSIENFYELKKCYKEHNEFTKDILYIKDLLEIDDVQDPFKSIPDELILLTRELKYL